MTTTFDKLGVADDLVHALSERGIDSAFAIQEMTIPDILAGRDVCGKAKTGSGKTLAFGLPLLQILPKAHPGHPTALALVPTRELATQVRDELLPLYRSGRNVAGSILGLDVTGEDVEESWTIPAPGSLVDGSTPGAVPARQPPGRPFAGNSEPGCVPASLLQPSRRWPRSDAAHFRVRS